MDASLRKKLDSCVRCGTCRSVCPVFNQTLLETDCSRGRLFALAQQDRIPSFALQNLLGRCLLCGACEAKCPASVPVTDLVRRARQEHRLSLLKRAIFSGVLPKAENLRFAGRAGKLVSFSIGRRISSDSGLWLRGIPERFGGARRLPDFSSRDFLSDRGTHVRTSNIAIFVGCVFSHLMPEVAEAAIKVLHHLGDWPDVPRGQACCGLMAYGAGDSKSARRTALGFLRTFEPYATILTLCASCTTMLKRHLPEVLPEAAPTAARVQDVHDYLEMRNFRAGRSGPLRTDPLAYHAPCHFRFTHPADAPRRLLENPALGHRVDLPEGCCGFGGTFCLSHPRISRNIGRTRAAQISASGAGTVATSCSGCLLGLINAVQHLPAKPRVRHPLEMLAGSID